jgi:hypothetical protein
MLLDGISVYCDGMCVYTKIWSNKTRQGIQVATEPLPVLVLLMYLFNSYLMENYLILYVLTLLTVIVGGVVHFGKRDIDIEFLGISIHLKSK